MILNITIRPYRDITGVMAPNTIRLLIEQNGAKYYWICPLVVQHRTTGGLPIFQTNGSIAQCTGQTNLNTGRATIGAEISPATWLGKTYAYQAIPARLEIVQYCENCTN